MCKNIMVIIRHLIGVLFWWYSYYQLQEYCTLLACNYKIIIFFLLWYYKMPSLTLQLHTKPPPYAFLPFGRRPRSPVNKHAAVRASFPHHCPQQAVAKTFKWTHVPVKVLCSLWLCLCVSLMSPIAVVMCVQAVVNKFPQKPPCVNLIFW